MNILIGVVEFLGKMIYIFQFFVMASTKSVSFTQVEK